MPRSDRRAAEPGRPQSTARADVAIVGAGPAGSWAARSLASRGARVLLIDPSHPREKACGGGVTGRALDLIAPLAAGRFPSCAISTATFIDSPGRRKVSVPLATSGEIALVVASRRDFDGALLSAARAAGAEFLPARVLDVSPSHDGFQIETSAGPRSAAALVGADGANSLVRRRLAAPFRRDQLSIATGYFARGVSSTEIVIELVSDPPGYLWSFPRPDHLAVGICAQADAGSGAGALRARALDWIRSTRLVDGAPLDPYSWPIPSLSARDFERAPLGGPRWYLVGDAAGLVDPITREGISFALLSGAWAADALSSNDVNAARWYAGRVRDEIIRDLAFAARLKARFFHPGFSRMLLDGLAASHAVRRVMADLVAGRQPYSTLRWRLVRTLEIGLAWRLLVSARRSRLAP